MTHSNTADALSFEQLKELVITALEDFKAIDIQSIDVSEQNPLTELFVIASGNSSRHVKSMAENVVMRAKAAGHPPLGVEGQREADWVLVDLNDVIVHLMLPQARAFYNLEKLWEASSSQRSSVQQPAFEDCLPESLLMQFIVVAIGQRMPSWVQQAWSEYARRFPKPFSLDLRELPLEKRARNADIERLRNREGDALLSSVPSNYRIITLDVQGKQCTTMELAGQMENWMREERGVCFLVGGPDGLSRDCRQGAHQCWSLGRLTLPHPLVRVVLAEQLYRAWSVTQNHPYHRA